jgi:cytoskeletal protein RodZ
MTSEYAKTEDYALQEAFRKIKGRDQIDQIDKTSKKRKEKIEDNEGGGIKSTFQKIKKWFKIIFWTIVIIIALCYILPEIL